ncbi:hypothetical protein SAMN05660909_03630 [Chitinophaga terrae (ex Kim and Jung 2007)]|uniref:Uncharacterized protein n=1 Tax=Chitinophaga terrae (ex Kim and Jung 2007) TaxID=408074 RepID=A0A1H4EBQ8_9BACT|nr:hypothetical protein [Chitinophaga terrae (ex Kim and Jung 2007)]SEA82483.1 hypothetical protein SAMN05660909_03630 [Chitinophaga terrae (ex Kim and Jung 2007)]
MLMNLLTVVHTTNFYKVGDSIGSVLAPAAILLFAAMFVYAWVKYAKN